MGAGRQLNVRQLRKKSPGRATPKRRQVRPNLQLLRQRLEDMQAMVDPTPPPPSFRLALKALRNRAQLSAHECSVAIQMSVNGYQRYENVKDYDSQPIPYRIIKPLIGLMVGKGMPPIEEWELVNISDRRDVPGILSKPAPSQNNEPQSARTLLAEYSPVSAVSVPIRYLIERGTYREAKRSAAHYGTAPVYPLRSYDQGAQWAGVVNGPDGRNYGFKDGAMLHCVDTSAVPPGSITAGLLVVARRTVNGLTEILLAKVIEATPSGYRLQTSDHDDFDGEILGIPMYQYTPL
jgi:hypothetical protein